MDGMENEFVHFPPQTGSTLWTVKDAAVTEDYLTFEEKKSTRLGDGAYHKDIMNQAAFLILMPTATSRSDRKVYFRRVVGVEIGAFLTRASGFRGVVAECGTGDA